MPSPRRLSGSTSAAAVAAAVVPAEKPNPCRTRHRRNSPSELPNRGPTVPASMVQAPTTMTSLRPRASASGPLTMRDAAAAMEKVSAPMPARPVLPPMRSR